MNVPSAKPALNPWPYAIIAWFVVFAAAMAAWITFAVRQRMDLVRADYYEQEIRYQGHLDRMNRTSAIRGQVSISYDVGPGQVTVRLPVEQVASRPSGRIHFYRPSDAAMDFEAPLAVDGQGIQRIGVRGIRAGHWKVRLEWSAAGQEYVFEQPLVTEEPLGLREPGRF